jgi:acetyl esterase
MKKQLIFQLALLILAYLICLPMEKRIFATDGDVNVAAKVYKEIDNYQLKAYIFSPNALKSNKKRPAFLFFHGGGWYEGKPQDCFDICRQIAQNGWVAITFDYRLCTNDRITPIECIKDTKSAVRWARANAETLHIYPDKIVASGASAGGHLAACTAMIAGINEISDNLAIKSEPNALVLYFPCVNTDTDDWFKKLLQNKLPVEETSPFHHVRAGLPPTVIFHGTKDEIVPYWTVVQFQQKMTQYGNRCILHTFENRKHVLFQTDAEDILRQTGEFLSELRWMNIPEKSL